MITAHTLRALSVRKSDTNSSKRQETPMIRKHNKSTKVPLKSKTNRAHLPRSGAQPAAPSKDGVQGEGNYQAAREFNKAEHAFVASGKVAGAARAAAPTSEADWQAMFAAEQEGKRRAKK